MAGITTLCGATAVIELGAGLALLCFPSTAAALLIGTPLEASAALTVARVGGAGLLALGVACWLARTDAQSVASRGLVIAMVVYNVGAVLVLGASGISSKQVGILLWPAVVLHGVMTVWCIASLVSAKSMTGARSFAGS
jgi:hypothetical protein